MCAAVERDIKWSSVSGDETDDNTHTLVSDAGEAFDGVERAVERLIKRFETTDVLMCISAGRNFRYSVDETYKANRKGVRKPLAYNAVLERVESTWPSFKFDGLEADDIMGIFGTREPNTIICSADKDMKTLPATLWDGKQLQKVDRATADWWFFYQVLVGDTADGYPGLPSVGPKKAEAILSTIHQKSSAEELWKCVKAAYEARGLTADDAIKQARLARILRNGDWDAKKKEPILWTPAT
jgi:5'-3' exonuclease